MTDPRSTPGPIVIVGAGQGGFQAAASLRQEGYGGPLTLIGDEPGLPYQRPPLSKAYLKDGRADRLALRPASFFERGDIRLLTPVAATRIDRTGRAVETSDGARHPYDHLILATGGVNAVPPVANLGLAGVYALRTLADAETIRARLPAMGHAVVVGGGFIGLEFASVARAAGIAVTVVEAADRLMARVVSPEMSAICLEAHRADGVEVRLGAFVAEVLDDGRGHAAGVRLADGCRIAGDTVLIAAGVRPQTGLAAAAGLDLDNGIAVDALLLTSDPSISAIGDCCSFPLTGGGRVRLESVPAATDHARAVARRLAGHPAPYTAVPWFWSDQGAMKLQIAGLTAGADTRTAFVPASGKAVVICSRGGTLVGVETINAPAEHMATRKLLATGRLTTTAELSAAGHDLRALLAAAGS